MNTLTALPDGATTNDARLEDICVSYDNTEYDSPGESVRTQISDVYTFIDDEYTNLKEKYKINIVTGKYLSYSKISASSRFASDPSVTSYYTDLIRVFPGEKYCYIGNSNALSYSVYWFDQNKTPLTYEQYSTVTAIIIVVPNDAAYAIFNSYNRKLILYLNEPTEILNRLDNSEKSDIPFYKLTNKYLNKSGNIVDGANLTSFITDLIPCSTGDNFIYNGIRSESDADYVCAVAWYGYNKKRIGYINPNDYDGSDVELTAPENTYYARFASYVYGSDINNLHLSVRYKNRTSTNSEKIKNMSVDIDSIKNVLSIEDKFSIKDDNKINICEIEDMHSGYINYTNGKLNTDDNTGGIYSDYFNLIDYDNIYITARAKYVTSILTLYDIDNKFIASMDKTDYHQEVIVIDKLYNVQELMRKYPNAAKFRLGSYQFPDASNTNFRAYTYKNSQSLHTKIDSIENSIDNIHIITSGSIGNVLYGKKYVAAGDSFTAGDFSGYTDSNGLSGKSSSYLYDSTLKMYKTYPWQIATRNNMTVINEAICGTTMAIHKNYFYDPENFDEENATHFANKRYKAIPDDADYLTLCFGLNEQSTWSSNPNSEHYPTEHPELAGTKIVPIGTSSDYTDKTIWGAWNLSLDYIIEHHPFLKIGIIIADAWTDTTMHNALITIAKYWGIPYLDLKNGENVPIGLGGRLDDMSDRVRILRNNAMYVTQSNGHPNLEAHKYRSTIIENFLRSL